MKILKLRILAATMLSSVAATASHTAAAVKDNAPDTVSEVIVTAQKRAESVQSVPLSITALSGKTLAANGVNDVLGLQKAVPSLRLDTIAQSAGVAIRIRGIGTASNAAIDPSVAPYIDGVFIPRPGAILTSFLDVDTVEVLRGPQGTLFGRNSTVGAISLRTAAPSLGGDSGKISAEAGDYGSRKIEAVGNLKVNDDLALRLAGFLSHTDGFLHDDANGQDYGRANTGAVRASAKVRITPALTWIGRVDFAQTTGDGINANQVDISTATPAQLAAFESRSGLSAANLTGPSFHTIQRFDSPSLKDRQIGVTSDLGWDLASGYAARLIDSYRSWQNAQTDGDVVFTPLDLLNRHDRFSSKSQSHELQFLSPKDKLLGGRFDFVSGLYYFDETYDTLEIFDLGSQLCGFVYGAHPGLIPGCSAAPQIGATTGTFHQYAQSLAAYVQANYRILPTVELTLGGRYTHDDKTGDFTQIVANSSVGAGVLRAPESTNLNFSDSRPTWKANLSWRIAPDIMAFATYSTGYKSGGFNNNGGAAALTTATRTFASETSSDIELGLKSTVFDHRLVLNADLYQTDLSNFQDRSFNGLTFIVRNAGNVRARGAEVESVIRPVDHIRIEAGAAYLDSVFTSNTAAPGLPACNGSALSCPTVQNLTGRPTTYAPKWQTDLAVEYDTSAFAGGWTGQLRGTLNYTSRMYTTNDDNPQALAGGQALLGARGTLVSPDKTWTFSVYGENLTNEKYFTLKFPQTLDSAFGVRVPATGATLMRGFMAAPLTFGGRITKSF